MSASGSRDCTLVVALGRLAEGEGFSRIGGRMLGLLTIAPVPHSIDTLARTLKVSRASISTNGKLLQSLGLIERIARPGDRRDYLRVRGDSVTVIVALGLRRLGAVREVLHALRTAGGRRSSERARLRRIEALYDNLIARLQLELMR